MKAAVAVGIILILFGIIGIATQPAAEKKQLAEVRPGEQIMLQAPAIRWTISPVLAVSSLAGGVVLIIISARR
jgi:uncharacterized membrane protein